jgi:hypothetical protein
MHDLTSIQAMLKKLIEPLQQILLQKKQCPGCTRNLDEQYDRLTRINQTEQVNCACGRIFIYDRTLDVYRRALTEEVR